MQNPETSHEKKKAKRPGTRCIVRGSLQGSLTAGARSTELPPIVREKNPVTARVSVTSSAPAIASNCAHPAPRFTLFLPPPLPSSSFILLSPLLPKASSCLNSLIEKQAKKLVFVHP
ncbi:hypothetical protein VTK26DRAFT_2182 [Humicola hyalothermophila]